MATINLGKVVPEKGIDYFTDADIRSLNVPRNTSDLTNDSGYITDYTEIDPTVPSHVKNISQNDISKWDSKADASAIPTKTSDLTNDSKFATENYVKSEIANAQLSGGDTDIDLSGYATKDEIPTKTSQLTNDSNFITSIPSEYVTETELSSKGYLTSVPNTYKTKTENDALYQPKGTYITSIPSEYVTDSELNAKGYLTEHQDISDLAKKDELHSHSNKSVLDNITQTNVNNWDNKSDFSGSYNDLTNKPTIPTKVSQLANDSAYASESYVTNAIANAQLSGDGNEIDLSGYATKDDLINKVDKETGKSLIADSEIERLASVTNYNDTEIRNTLATKANTSDIPTKVSQLTNDKNYLTSVPSTYKTKTENDALYQAKGDYLTSVPSEYITETELNNKGYLTSIPGEYVTDSELNAKGYLTEHQDLSDYALKTELHSHSNKTVLDSITSAKITSWDSKSTFSGSYNDLTNKPTIPTVPTKVSVFTNDAGYLTSIPSEYVTDTELNAKGYLTSVPSTYKTKTENDALYQAKGNYLTSYTESDPTVPSHVKNITTANISSWNNKSNFSGNYNDLSNKPTIPTKTSQLTNDSGFLTEVELTQEQLDEIIEEVVESQKVEFAESIDECVDTSKKYVLPDGYIYAYMLTEKEVVTGPTYENKLPLAVASGGGEYVGAGGEDGYNPGYRISSGGTEKAATGYNCTGFIPAVKGDTIRIKNVTQLTATNDGNVYAMVYFFTSAYAKTTGAVSIRTETTYENGVYSLTIPDYDTIAYFRVTLIGVSSDTIITVNEEITEGSTTTVTEYAWVNTKVAFTSANYEERIVALETDVDKLKQGITDTDVDPLELIKKWDAPIYDANIPVFELSTEKEAIADEEKTVEAVYAKYDALMAKHPNYITKTDLGMCSDGVTPVYRYDFREPEPHRGISGKKEWSETKAKGIIVSGIHWEWGGIFALYNALEEVAENPELYHLRRNTHLIVLPVCNPYAVANMSVRNANLVEIHRNFEVDFIYPGESGYIEIGNRSHGGTEPLSEVETQYIDNIFKDNTDAVFFLTCHSCQGDEVYGTGFIWSSPATYHMCNMAYRLIDKLSQAWMAKYGEELEDGIASYRTENTPEWDKRLGSAYLSTTNGTETKQATKYGIQGTNIEITDAFLTHGTKENTEPALSSFTMSRGAEVYANFFLIAFGVYDFKDKKEYSK